MARRRGAAQNEAGVDRTNWEPVTLKISPQAAVALNIQAESSRLNMGTLVDMLIRQAMPDAWALGEKIIDGLPLGQVKQWTLGSIDLEGVYVKPSATQNESTPLSIASDTSHPIPGNPAVRIETSQNAPSAPSEPVVAAKRRTSSTRIRSGSADNPTQGSLSPQRILELSPRLLEWSTRFAREVFAFEKEEDALDVLYDNTRNTLKRMEGRDFTKAEAKKAFDKWMKDHIMPMSMRRLLVDVTPLRCSIFEDGITPEEFCTLEDY